MAFATTMRAVATGKAAGERDASESGTIATVASDQCMGCRAGYNLPTRSHLWMAYGGDQAA